MQRKPLFLVAVLVELLRFFALALMAMAVAALRPKGLDAGVYRYLAVPQLLFGVVFFLLWQDGHRYEVYRPLALAGKAVSLLAWVALFVGLLGGERDPRLLGYLGFPALLFVAAADLFGAWVLLFCKVEGTAGPGAPKATGPTGPEDIESVEG